MLMDLPAWVSEPPQNTPLYYYGVGVSSGKGPEAIDKAKLKALQDLSSRIFVTVDSVQTESRSTEHRSTFFGKYKDETKTDSEVEISSYLSDIPGISVKKMEVLGGTTYCLIQLDRIVLQTYFFNHLSFTLEEMRYLRPGSRAFEDKASSVASMLNKARNLGVSVYLYEIEYHELKRQTAPVSRPSVTVERHSSQISRLP
jgi:hypothetical protein